MNDAVAALVALLMVSAAPAALAQDQKPHRMNKEQAIERMFERLDADKSGAIEAEESKAAAQKRFERLDADGDGVISREEAMKPHAARKHAEERRKRGEEFRAKRFAALDADGDGKVTLEEFQAKHGEMFARADANGDGKVTKDEIASRWSEHRGGKHRK